MRLDVLMTATAGRQNLLREGGTDNGVLVRSSQYVVELS